MDRPPCLGTAVAVVERRSMLAERCRGIGAALAPHTFALRVPAARFVNLATSVTGLVGTVEKCSARSLETRFDASKHAKTTAKRRSESETTRNMQNSKRNNPSYLYDELLQNNSSYTTSCLIKAFLQRLRYYGFPTTLAAILVTLQIRMTP